jgi:hypothetical protein
MLADLNLRLLAGALALAIGGTAMANTTLSTSTGDVFVNIVDTSNNTSFLFDTGVTQAAFNGGTTQSFNFASDPNYTAFLAAEGGSDNVDYSVFSATTGTIQTVFFTSSVSIPGQTGSSGTAITGAISAIGGFLVGANSITSSTANSVNLASTYEFGTALNEGKIATGLLNTPNTPYGDNAALGTAMAFYDDAAGRSGVSTYGAVFAGTWDVSGGVATYTTTSAVPLPTPLVLLLSGLGLMGVVTRRHKAA